MDSVRNSVNNLINRYRTNDEGDGGNGGAYIEFQEYHKLDSEKPLYPHLETHINQNPQADLQRSSLKENISLSGSFIREMS